ncbi:MAG: alkaline phosphatase family protein [Anaerolineae bacterium]
MNFLSRMLIDLWQVLLSWYYSWRYGPVARRLETPPHGARKGFIVVQIDGLGHDSLLDAITKGYAPYIGSLLRSGQAEALRWFTGLPSTTPYVQAGIMFGSTYDIPGFRWYDKAKETAIVCKYPGVMSHLQAQVSYGRRGILEGGASYANMFDGGASISLFTLSAFGRTSLIEKVGGLGLFLVLLFSPIRVLRIIVLSAWTYLSGLWRQVSAVFWPNKFGRLGFFAPFFHVLTDVVVREIETFATLVDIYRGVPAIYVTYTSYDEWAHRFGPSDKYAYRAVKAIDRQVQQIDRMRRHGTKGEYDLFLLSDHGIARCVSFETIFGSSLGQVISASVVQPVMTDETQSGTRAARAAHSLLGDEVAVAERRLFGLSSEAARSIKRALDDMADVEPIELAQRSDVIVRNSGPLSHIYFNVSPDPMDAGEIESAYPGLMHRLAHHPGIGVVAVRTAAEPLLLTCKGAFPCREVAGEEIFVGLPNAPKIAGSLAKLLSFPHSGDLVLLGKWGLWGVRDLVVSFERQRGTHGGVGGEQCYPFFLALAEEQPDVTSIDGPEALYHFFMSYSEMEAPLEQEREAWRMHAGGQQTE